MKTKQLLAVMAAAVLAAASAPAQSFNTNLTFTVNQAIPDADNSGLALVQNLTLPGLPGPITEVTVSLDISGGFNGDLYAYLAGPGTGFAVLLNRTDVDGTHPFGSTAAGFNITLDDSAVNPGIHTSAFSGGPVAGVFDSDGENIDPQSADADFPAARTDLLTSFNGNLASGTWTLFLADLSAGGVSTINSWGLDITAAPEPGTLALAAIGGIALLTLRHSRHRKL